MAELLERLTRRLAKRTTIAGADALVTDGDPDLVEAFQELGWQDPQVAAAGELEAAVLGEPEEKAVERRPKARGSR